MAKEADYASHRFQDETTGSRSSWGRKNVSQAASPESEGPLRGKQLAEGLAVMEDCLIAQLTGRRSKRSLRFPVRIHPSGSFLWPDVEQWFKLSLMPGGWGRAAEED